MSSSIPPLAVARAAAQGLALRREHGRGGTAVGVARARDLSNRRPVSPRTLRRMASYFARHAVDAQAPGWGRDSAGWIAWLLWGGDAGRAWAARELAKAARMKTRRNPGAETCEVLENLRRAGSDLDLDDPEDRSTFRIRVASHLANCKLSRIKQYGVLMGVVDTPNDRVGALRALSNSLIEEGRKTAGRPKRNPVKVGRGAGWHDRAHRANPKTDAPLSSRRSRNPPDPKAIIRIIKVRDTRQYEEGPDEKWYPIPGSGVLHECARCGRVHEVHAHVELADGSQAIVGTGCMGAQALNVEARKMASKAATVARAEGRLLRARQVLASFDTAVREIERMGIPEVQISMESSSTKFGRNAGIEVPTLKATAGDGYTWRVLQLGNVDTPQLRRQMAQEAVRDWTERRLQERGFKYPRLAYENEVETAERLARRAGAAVEPVLPSRRS